MTVPGNVKGAAGPPLPRYRRTREAVRGLLLQERDTAVLRDVWRCGVLTTTQIEWMRSADESEELRFVSRLTLTRRLQLLFHHGYVRRIARPCAVGSLEPAYLLDQAGARALIRAGETSAKAPGKTPRPELIERLVDVSQVRAAVVAGCAMATAGPCLRVTEWRYGKDVKFAVQMEQPGARRHKITVEPAGFFSLRADRQRLFYFLEIDGGHESEAAWTERFRAYHGYWKGGGFGRDFSIPAQVGFRVICVAPDAAQVALLKSAIASLTVGRSMYWVVRKAVMRPDTILQRAFCEGDSEGA